MARAISLLERAGVTFIVPEIDDGTLRRATPHTFVASASTAATVTSAALAGANAYDYIGCWLEPDAGAQVGIRRQIVAFNPGTDTATVDPAWPGNPGTVTFRMRRPTEPVIRVRSAGGSATSIDADAAADAAGTPARDEAAEFWSDNATDGTVESDRVFAWGLRGDNINRAALITNDGAVAAGEKTFTVAAGAGWTAGTAGDLVVIRKYVRPRGGKAVLPETARVVIERDFLKGASGLHEQEPHALGPRMGDGSITMQFEVQGLGATPGATAVARGPIEVSDLLRGMFALSSGSNRTTSGVPTATSVPVGTGTGDERGRAGDIVLIQGEAAQVRSIADGGVGDDTLTLATGHLSGAPAAGVTVFGGWNLRPITEADGYRTTMVETFPGGRRMQFYGWLPSLKISGVVNDGIATLEFSGPFDGYTHDGFVLPTLTTSAGGRFPVGGLSPPTLSRGGRVVLGGALFEGAIEFTFDVGLKVVPRPNLAGADGREGFMVVDRKTMGTIRAHWDNFTQLERFQRGDELDLLIQLGTQSGATFAIACPAIQYTGVESSFDDGAGVQNLPFRVLRSNVSGTDAGSTIAIQDLTITHL